MSVNKIEYFDYERVAREMKVPNTIVRKIEKEVQKEFPFDKMLYELHVLKAIKSKYWLNESIKEK